MSDGLEDEGLCKEGDKEGAKLKLPWWALSACCPFVGVVSWLLVQVPVVGVVVSSGLVRVSSGLGNGETVSSVLGDGETVSSVLGDGETVSGGLGDGVTVSGGLEAD